MSSDKNQSDDFAIWRGLLQQTVNLASEIGCQPAVVEVLHFMIGEPERSQWSQGVQPHFLGDFKTWDKFAREAVAKLAPEALGELISQAFATQLRFEKLQGTHMDYILLRRVYPDGGSLPRLTREAWKYINWASSIVILAACKRKPVLDDKTAVSLLRTMLKAILHWAGDFVSEPDLPMKEVMALLAAHRYRIVEQTMRTAERIELALALVPAADAADRKYVAKLKASVDELKEALKQAWNEPAAGDEAAGTPTSPPYPSAHFHRDWDRLARDQMKTLGFTRIKGTISRWSKPVGDKWLYVGFYLSKWGWTQYGGNYFFVSVDYSASADPAQVSSRDTLHFFATYSDEEYAPFLQLNDLARNKVKNLKFPPGHERQMHEFKLMMLNRSENRRIPGDVNPEFRYYDADDVKAWAAALLPALGRKLEQAVAGASN